MLDLMIEFLPGLTILFLFAVIEHANIVRENKKRFSFMQYSMEGLFWWTNYNFQTKADFVHNNLDKKQKLKADKLTLWSKLLKKLSVVGELRKDHTVCSSLKD